MTERWIEARLSGELPSPENWDTINPAARYVAAYHGPSHGAWQTGLIAGPGALLVLLLVETVFICLFSPLAQPRAPALLGRISLVGTQACLTAAQLACLVWTIE